MIDLNAAEKLVLDNVSRALRDGTKRTSEDIRTLVDLYAGVANITIPELSVRIDELVAEIAHAASVWTQSSIFLTDGKVRPWWIERKPEIEPMRFWRRYRTYLAEEKSFGEKELDSVDEQTDTVLDRIEDPTKEGVWDVRGMVVGSVQSGKTANYTGVIAKALDAGYKIIIVLGGIHKNLRAQTQERIDEGIVGFDSQRRPTSGRSDYRIGVGKIISPELGNTPGITTMTSSADNGDFTARAQSVNVSLKGGPIIMVVKKNVSPLRNILSWLDVAGGSLGHKEKGQPIEGIPLLLIDDEADNASINTKDKPVAEDEETNITATNQLIRLILTRFDQSAYVGYTATPFANIFINPESERDEEGKDLFPRDFIVNVRPSSRYVGPAKIFGYSAELEAGIEDATPLPVFREISDHEDAFLPKQKSGPSNLPNSMIDALLSYVLACAARRLRGQKKAHCSMLIHVSHLKAVQEGTFELLVEEFSKIRRAIRYDSSNNIWQRLEKLWRKDFCPCTDAIRDRERDERLITDEWQDIAKELSVVVDKISIRIIHGTSGELLDYGGEPEGLYVVAIGGNKLSRGLTLEGLTVSYFLRSTRMYDTLMQMGRWFGYREGYLDLCRLYTTDELRDWFSHVAFAEEELKREFEHMSNARLTPADYGLRVRQHPDGMLVTALNKMAHGQSREVTFAGQLVQTAFFTRDAEIQKGRAATCEEWLKSLSDFRSDSAGNLRWTATRAQILGLLERLRKPGYTHPKCSRFGPELASFIEAQEESGGLAEWTVIVPKGVRKEAEIAGGTVKLVQRKDVSSHESYYSLSKANVQDPAHEILDLDELEFTPELLSEALAKLEITQRANQIPLIHPGEETQTITALLGRPVSEAVIALGKVRGREGASRIREEVRQLRPSGRGLLILYAISTEDVRGLGEVRFVPGLALSFPATDRARRVHYMVNKAWIKEQLDRYELGDIFDEED
jgi:Z1 domain